MYPFLKKHNNKIALRLHKDLYKKDILQEIKRKEPAAILSLKSEKQYHLIELNADSEEEYFNFLNYLIYSARSA